MTKDIALLAELNETKFLFDWTQSEKDYLHKNLLLNYFFKSLFALNELFFQIMDKLIVSDSNFDSSAS